MGPKLACKYQESSAEGSKQVVALFHPQLSSVARVRKGGLAQVSSTSQTYADGRSGLPWGSLGEGQLLKVKGRSDLHFEIPWCRSGLLASRRPGLHQAMSTLCMAHPGCPILCSSLIIY